MDDKEEKSLEELLHMRDVELPLVKKGLQDEMQKIKKSLENMERDEKALNIKIDAAWRRLNLAGASSKTILDVPHVLWSLIGAEFVGQEHHLLNACLASAELESLITKNSAPTKLKMLGEKVFSVLVKNYYINGGDLMNCLNTGSRDFEIFAEMSWWLHLQSRFFEHAVNELQEVKMMHLKCIQDFHEKATKEKNKWILFRNKHLLFESRRIRTKLEYEGFWNAAFSLLKKFGGFIISLQIKDNSSFAKTEANRCNFDVDLSLIPRMKYFETQDIVVSTYINKKTFDPFFEISADYNKLETSSMIKLIRHSITRVSIDSETPTILKAHRPEFVELAKELSVINANDKMILFDVNQSTGCKAGTAVFTGFDLSPTRSISLLKHIPNVKAVILDMDWDSSYRRGIDGQGFKKVFPTVKNFTWGIRQFPGSMDALPEIFPNLRRLELKCVKLKNFPTFRELMVFWNVADIFDDYVIDAFHLYTENVSLKESNIWNHFVNLKLLCVQSLNVQQPQPGEILAVAGEGDQRQRQMYYGRHEIYTRTENGSIRFDNVISKID